jgi:hypothetical protein
MAMVLIVITISVRGYIPGGFYDQAVGLELYMVSFRQIESNHDLFLVNVWLWYEITGVYKTFICPKALPLIMKSIPANLEIS